MSDKDFADLEFETKRLLDVSTRDEEIRQKSCSVWHESWKRLQEEVTRRKYRAEFLAEQAADEDAEILRDIQAEEEAINHG